MTLKENKKMELLTILFCVCLLVPLLMVSIYNRPAADDYDYSIATHDLLKSGGSILGLFAAAARTVTNFYIHWQGTYTSAFVMSFQPGIFGERAYMLAMPMILGSCFLFLRAAVHIMNSHFLKKSFLYSLAITCVLGTILVLWLPYPREGIFWYNGAMHYMPWFFLTLFNLALLFFAGKNLNRFSGKSALLLSVVISVLLSGANQSSAFGNILLVLVFVLYELRHKRYYPLLPFLLAVVGFVIMFIAPGNANRQGDLPRQGVMDTIWATWCYVFPMMSKWLSFEWVLSLILITPIAMDIAKQKVFSVTKWTLAISLAVSFVVLCGMLCVPYMAMAYFGPERMTNMHWIAFMFFTWVNYLLFLSYLVQNGTLLCRNDEQRQLFSLKTTACVCVCLLLLCILPNGKGISSSRLAVEELRKGIPQQHAEEMDWRYGAFNDESLEEAGVYPVSVKSELLSHTDLSTDPDEWPNSSIENYYRKRVYLLIPYANE